MRIPQHIGGISYCCSGLLGALLCCTAALAGEIVLHDAAGKACTPLNAAGKKAVCLIFIAHDCPIANQFAPELGRICDDYAGKDVAFYFVHVDAALKAEKAAAHAKEYALRGRVLLDPERKLAAAAGATVTPEAVVFTAKGDVAYRGRINDLYADLGKKRAAPTQHDLRNALDAVLAGKPPANSSAPAVGCLIQPLAQKKEVDK